jgi:RNA polymerase sigma-70 factor (ECF subfamily)
VAQTLLNWARIRARVPEVSTRFVEVNGGPGAVFLDGQQRVVGVWAIEVDGGEITSVSSIVNPEKLTHLGPVGNFGELLRQGL